MRRVVVLILLALTTVSLLTGCLVHKKKSSDVAKIYRTTDKLHVYQDGDYINYTVIATISPNDGLTPPVQESGTLKIQWNSNIDLIRPKTGPTITSVIKETSLLSIGGGTPTGLVRYISQDAAGQITLHAVEDNSKNMDWLSDTDLTGLSASGTQSYTVFYSDPTLGIQFGHMPPLPAAPTQPITFYVMYGCGDGICDSKAAQFTDYLDVMGDSTSVTTTLGIFENPFQIDFHGNNYAWAAGTNLFAITDLRDICSTGNNGASTDYGTTIGDGTMYVMPQVGMIQMRNTCHDLSSSGNTTVYTITISDTNIHL